MLVDYLTTFSLYLYVLVYIILRGYDSRGIFALVVGCIYKTNNA